MSCHSSGVRLVHEVRSRWATSLAGERRGPGPSGAGPRQQTRLEELALKRKEEAVGEPWHEIWRPSSRCLVVVRSLGTSLANVLSPEMKVLPRPSAAARRVRCVRWGGRWVVSSSLGRRVVV